MGFQKPDAGVPASGPGFNEEVGNDVKPAQHNLEILNDERSTCRDEQPSTF